MKTLQEIKAWLKANRIRRDEFAERLGVAKGTVDIWLSGGREINEVKMKAIELLMEGGALATPAPAHTKVSAEDFKAFPVLLTDEDYELCLRAADARGLTVSDWAADVCAEEAAAFLKKEEAARKAAAEAPTAAPPATPDPQAPPA